MADKMADEIVIPCCSKSEVIDSDLITGKNRKRELSISESEFEYNDHTDTSNCETSTNKKKTPCKDNQSNAICNRISEQSLSDVIKKLTKQIEHIEKKVAQSQNIMKNTEVNDELIYQPPNKIIKYDVEVISAESCNSDENSIRSTKNINTTKHVNKKIKLDKNTSKYIIFQEDDDSERDYKSLTNEEVEMLLELPYNLDDKILFDDEHNTCIKIQDAQINEEKCNPLVCKDDVIFFETEFMSNSNKIILSPKNEDDRNDFNEKVLEKKKFTDLNCGKSTISITDKKTSINSSDLVSTPDQTDKFNKSITHVFNKSMLDKSKIGFSTEDQRIDQSEGYHSNEIEVDDDEVLQSRAFNNNSTDTNSINQDDLLDLTKCENYEIMPDSVSCANIINQGVKCKSDSVSIPEQADKFNKSMLDNSEIGFPTENKIVSLSNGRSENIVNQNERFHFNEIEVNGDEVVEARACEDNADNSVTFNNQIKSSVVELCNSENETILINKLKASDYYEEDTVEGVIKQTIKDIMVSLDSSNIFCLGILKLPQSINDFQNIVEPHENYCINSKCLATQKKICFVPPHESKRTVYETSEYNNNNFDTSSKSTSDQQLIELRNGSKNVSSDYDTTDKIDSINIPDKADVLNTSIKHEFNESIWDTMKFGISTEDQSMSQSSDCAESSMNLSAEFVNVDEVLVLVPEMCAVDDKNSNDPESISQDDLLDLTNCENDEMMLNHETCTSIINRSINCTIPFDIVNSKNQTDCVKTTHCSGDNIHEKDFERMILQEEKLYDSTEHINDQEYVCKTQNNQAKNNFESSNTVDDLVGVHILDIHSKFDCENSLNQIDLLDTNVYASNQSMIENKNGTSIMNPEKNNENTLERLTLQEEEMFTKLFSNENYELGKVTVCIDKVTTTQTCEDYTNEKNVTDDEISDNVNSNNLSSNCGVDVTTVDNYEAAISGRNSQSSVTCDKMVSNMFYFGTEKVSLNNEIDNSIISENKTLLGIKNKNDYEEAIVEGIIEQIIEDIIVSLDSSNTFHYGLKNVCVNDSENILEPSDESHMNSKSLTTQEKKGFEQNASTNSSFELQSTRSETYEYNNNNIDTNSKSTSNQQLIELRNSYKNISSGYDTTTDKIDSINIPNKAYILNTSIKHAFNESIWDTMKFGISTEEQSMSQSSDCFESSINLSAEFVNVDEVLVLVPEMCGVDAKNSNDPESISQDDLLDLTNCENDEMILNHEICSSIINRSINCTIPFDIVNSENQTDCVETTHCSGDNIHKKDFERMILQEEKLYDSTEHINDQEYVCKTQNNQAKNNFESSNTVDDLVGVHILDIHSKFDCENSLNQIDLLDTNVYASNQSMIENKNGTSIMNPEKNNKNTLKRLTIQEEEMHTKLVNYDFDEFGIVTDCTDNDLLEVTRNIPEADASKINEGKRNFTNDEVFEDVYYNGLSTNCGMGITLSIINPEQRNESTLKTLTNEEKMLSKLVTNEDNESGIVTVCTDEVTMSQTCEDYIYENVSKKFKHQNDLLEVTLHISDENTSISSKEKRSDQADKHNTSLNHENDDTIFNNKENDILTERSLSFNSNDARQILESSNDDSKHLDDSLLFKPSDRDLVKYGLECEEYEKSISLSLNNLENNVRNNEVISQCKSTSLKLNEMSKSVNNLVSSSYAKDYEDNVIDFYDCDLSSIENSDIEDNLLLSFENDSSIDDCMFNEKKDKLKNTTNSTSDKESSKNNSKIQNVGFLPESYNNSTNVVETPVSLIHSPSQDHQCNKIMSTNKSMKQIRMNPDADDKLESFNHTDVKITTCNPIPSFNESDNINRIQSDDLRKDPGELKDNSNKDQNLEGSNENHIQNKNNKSISEYNTHQSIEKSQNPCKNNGSESSKVSSMKNTENEEIAKINTVKSTTSDINQSEIEKKKYLDEIIKNEQLFNKLDEKLYVNKSAISPYITQSLVKSANLKSALAKKAAANINIRDMGDKALSTYLTQQTMTLDVLKVLHKSLDTCPSSGVLMEDPEGLVVSLMPHQKHAIAWLIWRESQEPRGGILADDMGLGKTLSMLSLILKLKGKPQDSLLPLEESIDNRRKDVITGGTLVVCPASLINQWETEVKTKLKPGLLNVGQYYGINRHFSALELAENDLVITSYHVVMWDHKIRQNSSPLYTIKWDRVILDEGHNIRNHKTQTSVAVCNIKSINRWAITGTPIHNKEADFFTLLKFVRCKPFDDWPVWKRWVGNNDDAGKHRLSLLVKTLMLRRTKTELTQFTTFNLPEKKIITIEIELSKEERNAYETLLRFSSNLFATYLYDRAAKEKLFDPSIKVQCKVQYFQEQSQDKDEVFKDHPELLKLFKQFKNIDEIQTYHILVLLLRLRQMCCHPILIKGPITEESIKKEDNIESISEDKPDVTYNENTDTDTSPNNIDLSDLMSCLTLEDESVKIESVIDTNIFQKTYVSSKIKKICDLVNQKILINGVNDKAIIVSQWPSFLYLIKRNLAHYNSKIEMFSGAIPIPKRNEIIREFNNPNSGLQILLLSLKAGGVGLNLMAANHMFLIDVHWNPQLEAQACDRVYRVGQRKPVYIYKFISNNTIETRILNIQALKLQIAENLFKGGTSVTSKITIDDLKQIFQFH